GLDRCTVGRAVHVGRGLDSQFADALQVVVDFVQIAFGGLGQRDAVVSIAGSLGHALDLGSHAVGDGLASGVVLGAVDAQARGQALNRGAQGGLGLVQVVLGDQSEVVGVDNSHERLLRDAAKDSPFLPRMTNRVTSCSAPLTEGGWGTLGLSRKNFYTLNKQSSPLRYQTRPGAIPQAAVH